MVVETPRRFYLILSVWKNCSNRKNVNVFVEDIFTIIIKNKKNLFECLPVLILIVIFARNYVIGTSGWFFAPVAWITSRISQLSSSNCWKKINHLKRDKPKTRLTTALMERFFTKLYDENEWDNYCWLPQVYF